MYHLYSFPTEKKLIISNFPLEKIKSKFGYKFERLTSVKERESIPIIVQRVVKNYAGFVVEEHFLKAKTIISDEHRKKISESKLGKPRSEEVRARISAALKGRSNFQGKSHSVITKAKMATAKMGNTHTKGTVWAHNPRSDEEVRVKTIRDVPVGFSKGRDYYSTEPGLYFFNSKRHLG